MLPAFVKKRVKEGVRYIAEDQGTVTLVFCDICEFDTICTEYLPIELTAFLDDLFQKFDQFCTAIGVTKIETVGKTYMACAGLKDSEAEMEDYIKQIPHARRAIELAFAMISHVQSIGLKNGSHLKVKIGINSGPVTAGVVGYHKPQFSLVGDTVNTASRMCSTIENYNQIQISKETYDLIGDYQGLSFLTNKVEAKGKGILDTYFVSESIQASTEIETLQLNPENKTPLINSFMNSYKKLSLIPHMTLEETNEKDFTNRRRNYRNSQMFAQLQITRVNDVFEINDSEILENIKIFDFSCKPENESQKQFRINQLKNNHKMMNFSLLIALVNFSILLLFSITEFVVLDEFVYKENLIARSIFVVALLIVWILHDKIYLSKAYPVILIGILSIMVIDTLFYITFNTQRPNDLIALEIMYIILLLNFTSGFSIAVIIWSSLSIFIP